MAQAYPFPPGEGERARREQVPSGSDDERPWPRRPPQAAS
jgi:hypothetical protein